RPYRLRRESRGQAPPDAENQQWRVIRTQVPQRFTGNREPVRGNRRQKVRRIRARVHVERKPISRARREVLEVMRLELGFAFKREELAVSLPWPAISPDHPERRPEQESPSEPRVVVSRRARELTFHREELERDFVLMNRLDRGLERASR